jgi:type IV secretion system protein VirD4
LPYVAAAAIGHLFLFASGGSTRSIRFAGWDCCRRGSATMLIAACAKRRALTAWPKVSVGEFNLSYLDPATMIGAGAALTSDASHYASR